MCPKGLLGGSQRRANQVFLDSPIHRWLASFFGPILQPHPQTPWQTKKLKDATSFNGPVGGCQDQEGKNRK
jgi:hypothetical protein